MVPTDDISHVPSGASAGKAILVAGDNVVSALAIVSAYRLEVSYEAPCCVISDEPLADTAWQTRQPVLFALAVPAMTTGSVVPGLMASVAAPNAGPVRCVLATHLLTVSLFAQLGSPE